MEKLKEYGGFVIGLALLVGAIAGWRYVDAYAQSIQPSSFRSFSATGEGKAVSVPDVATFSFSVVTEGGTGLAALQTQNTTKVNAAIDYLKSQHIDAKDITTTQYDVSPRYQYYNCNHPESSVTPCPPASIVGYTITQSVRVKVRDFNVIGDILSAVVTKGANTVSSLTFTVDDPTSVENAARAQAIEKAKAKAEAIAQAGGFSLGRLLAVDEGGSVYPVYYDKTMSLGMGGGGVASAPAPAVEPGSQDVTVNVTLRYEIQ